MIALLILSTSLLLLVYAIFKLYIRPKQTIAFYQKTIGTNFKVYTYRFIPLQATQFIQCFLDQRKYKDPFKTYKDVCSQFDVTISTVVDKVQLNFVSPKFMHAFYQLDEKYYKKNELIINGLKRMVGVGLTFSEGDVWKMKRRVTTKMLNFTYVRSLVPKIHQIVKEKSLQLISKKQPDSQGFYQIDILDLTTQIASTVVLQLFFGGGQTNVNDLKIRQKSVNQHMRKLLEILQKQLLTNPLVVIFGEKYCKLGLTKLDRQVNSLLADFNLFTSLYIQKRLAQLKQEYKNGKQYPQVFTDLVQAYYVEQILKKNEAITANFIQSLVDDFATLFVAGTDTTSHAAQMAIYHTFKNTNIKDQLQAQIKQHIPSFNEATYDSFKNCTFLEAILTENTRIYSTANGIFPRQAVEDHTITVDGISLPIKKGTLVNIQTITTHYKKSIYNDPDEFRPQRYIDKAGKIINPEPYTLMNFSAGTRSCVGKQLALTEQRIILTSLANFYDIKVDDSKKEMVFSEFAYNLRNVRFWMKPIE